VKYKEQKYKLNDFLPLIVIFLMIISVTVGYQLYYGFSLNSAMRIFMAAFFIVFSLFKISNLREFAKAYATYDLIAKRFLTYAYIYPFIELILGMAFLLKINLFFANLLTLVLMTIGALGVFMELRKGSEINCACLGVVFKIPMTYVTLLEDIIMAFMALIMLFI
jgi:hypothetical protein